MTPDRAPIAQATAPEGAALNSLLRWEAAGGTWVERAAGDSLVVDLISCDGGEVMGRITSSRPEFIAYVRSTNSRR